MRLSTGFCIFFGFFCVFFCADGDFFCCRAASLTHGPSTGSGTGLREPAGGCAAGAGAGILCLRRKILFGDGGGLGTLGWAQGLYKGKCQLLQIPNQVRDDGPCWGWLASSGVGAFTDSGSEPGMTDFGFYKIPDCSSERLICLRSVLSHPLGRSLHGA